MTGTIMKALSGFYYVDCEGTLYTCRARGKFRHKGESPLVGDRVEIADLGGGTGSVDLIGFFDVDLLALGGQQLAG